MATGDLDSTLARHEATFLLTGCVDHAALTAALIPATGGAHTPRSRALVYAESAYDAACDRHHQSHADAVAAWRAADVAAHGAEDAVGHMRRMDAWDDAYLAGRPRPVPTL